MRIAFCLLLVCESLFAGPSDWRTSNVNVMNWPSSLGGGPSSLTNTELRASAVPISIATMPSTPVTGTFWPATQPVSGTVTANATLAAETTKVIGTVNLPTLTKGTQGASGVSIQELKDAGRNQTNFWMAVQVVSTATDALMSLTGYKGGVAVVATTTPAVVTAGKTYRITSITMDYTTIVTTPGSIRFTLRANLAGVVAITSPAVATWEVGEPSGAAPVAGKKNTVTINFPDGIEFPAGTGIGVSQVGLSATGTAAIVGYGRITINGFEY